MNTFTRRIAAGFAVAVAPALISFGAATTSQAATANVGPGPSTAQIADAGYSHTAKAGVTNVRNRHHHGYHHRRR